MTTGVGRERNELRFGMPHLIVSVVRQFHNDMRARARLDGGECSGWFPVEQGLPQGCVLVPLLLNILFAAVISVTLTRFEVDEDVMNALLSFIKQTRAGRYAF